MLFIVGGELGLDQWGLVERVELDQLRRFGGDDQLSGFGGDDQLNWWREPAMWLGLAPPRPIPDFFRFITSPLADYAFVLLRAWAKKGYVDPKRIGIWGWVSLVFS